MQRGLAVASARVNQLGIRIQQLAKLVLQSVPGSGMRICPAARPDDGLLQVVVVGPLGRAQFVRMKPKVYSGAHVDHPTVTVYRAARVELHADGITGYADGERAFALPVTVECVPGALTVLTS